MYLKLSYTLRNSKFSSIFVWQIKKTLNTKVVQHKKPITLILSKSSFDQRFKNLFLKPIVTIRIKTSFHVPFIQFMFEYPNEFMQHHLGCALMYFVCHCMVSIKVD